METLLYFALSNAVLVAVLAVVVAGITRIWRRPEVCHVLWLLVLLKLITPPLFTVPLPTMAAPSSAVAENPRPIDTPSAAEGALSDATPASGLPTDAARTDDAPAGLRETEVTPAADASTASTALLSGETLFVHDEPTLAADAGAAATAGFTLSDVPWTALLLGLWLGGVGLWCGVLAVRLRQLRRLLSVAHRGSPCVQERTRQLAARLGLRRAPAVWFVPVRMAPALWALAGAPRLLIPVALWERLSVEEQDTLLAHELAHLRRGDHWVRRLELVLSGLYWWHPVVWWARRELEKAEEICCDAWVLRTLPQSAHAYAAALLQAVRFLSQPQPVLPPGASGMGQVPLLKRRLTMILGETRPRTLPRVALWSVLGLGALLLPFLPIGAQSIPAQSEPLPPVAPEPAPASVALTQAAPATAPTDQNLPPRSAAATSEPQANPFGGQGWRAHSADDLKEEIALLTVNLRGKRAELQEVRALLKGAERRLGRAIQLGKNNAIGDGEIDQARTEVEVLQARLELKEAQVEEASLRIAQAEKRAKRQAQPAQGKGAASMAPTGMYSPPISGTAPRGVGQGGAAAQNTPTMARNAPGGSPGTSTAYPAAPTPGELPAMSGGGALMPSSPKTADVRMKELETKLDLLLKEIEALRRDVQKQKPRTAPSSGAPSLPGDGGAPVPASGGRNLQ